MRQIDRIARELKSELCGEYHETCRKVTIYLDTDDDELYADYFEEEEYFKSTASWLTKLLPMSQNMVIGEMTTDARVIGN